MLHKLSLLMALALLVAGCGDKKKDTTPKNEPKEEVVDTSTNTGPKTVPQEHEMAVSEAWQMGFNAVKNCVSDAIKKSGQKGIKGYIHIQADIGTVAKPKNLKIVKKTLKVEGIEKCILDYLKDLEFPVWGYNVSYIHSYDLQIGY